MKRSKLPVDLARTDTTATLRIVAIALLIPAIPTLGACGDARDVLPEFTDELPVEVGELEEEESGLWVQELREGEGSVVRAGQSAVVHYTGWFPDGRKFDSSRDRGQPFTFSVGAGQVIEGWDEGVAGMREGGRRVLVIPPDLAYGDQGAGDVIPPGSWLVFDVEVLEIGPRR